MVPAIPIYLETALDMVFGVFQAPPPGTASGTAVLICAPWGWDEVASYRSRRLWSQWLSERGHPTLRFDLPATGDSAGVPADPDRLEAWLAAVGRAVEWLRETTEAPRLAAIGLGLGGLLARASVSRGAQIDEIALWGAPVSGRAFVRETQAFARLQAGRGADKGPGSDLPDGWLEASGFVLSAETLGSLRSLDPELPTETTLRRALLLGRDGIDPDAELRERFERAGVETEAAPGLGWAAMVGHPESTELPLEVADRVAGWLVAGDREAVPAGEFEPRAGLSAEGAAELGRSQSVALELEVDRAQVRETPMLVRQWFGDCFGVLAEPLHAPAEDLCAIFLNAGAVRHTGPNRLWVETARRWAARGVPSLRVDLEGIGESEGDDTKRSDVASFYVPEFEEQVRVAMDALEKRGLGKRFLLAGLCAGGYWSFRAGMADPRAETALLLNAGALTWHDNLLEQREARKFDRMFQRRWWGKLYRGEVRVLKPADVARLGRAKVGSLPRRLGGRSATAVASNEIDLDLDAMRDAGTSLRMAFSADEPLHAELAAEGILDQLDRWPNLELQELPGSDHTLRSVAAQNAAAKLLDGELERVLSG
jgi:alpha-beta hydrolase superfamily lysophospholipase